MDHSTGTSDADARANELYWGSDRSVNQIADELDLSKGALYEMIRPSGTGLGCPECGAEVVHSNRTAKERAQVDCPSCGWDGTEEESVPGDAPIARVRTPADEESDPDPYDAFGVPAPQRARHVEGAAAGQRAILGGALLGAAVGLALVIWARRR